MQELRENIARNEAEIAARTGPRVKQGVDLVAMRINVAKQELARLEAEDNT
jgi:uncharacterized small protein (DUF1192 family)